MKKIDRLKVLVKGIVQGVGFRPFIYKIALENKLMGWVLNDSNGVTIEVEGEREDLLKFINFIRANHPPLAFISEIKIVTREINTSSKYTRFEIIKSLASENRQTLIAPDNNVCVDCLRELFAEDDRRYKYPFINCTNCGPRYSIIENIPYDRKYTTMKSFKMCDECYKEYSDPLNRRFHAQPNACFECGPRLTLLDNKGNIIDESDAIQKSIKLLKDGKIIAIKGVGGFHLVVDPLNIEAVKNLRIRKKRKHKPLALMSENLGDIKSYCKVSIEDEKVLKSKERPIVLLRKKEGNDFPDEIAPLNNYFGVMLPYTPLHYLLLKNNFKSLIFTSGNISDEPIIFKDEDAVKYLGKIADYILTNNRDIFIRIDDSIASNIKKAGSTITQISRRARGYVPKPLSCNKSFKSGLALGAELKNTICLNRGKDFFISQYIGDLKNQKIYQSHKLIIEHLKTTLEIKPEFLVSDMHPSFLNTKDAAEQKELPVIQAQHHHAHMASCMFENNLEEEVIGVIYDGVGYGLDGNFWGAEFLTGDYKNFKRIGHYNYFKLIGGDRAVKEPYRIALSLLFDTYGDKLNKLDVNFLKDKPDETVDVLYKMHKDNINSYLTSGMGRIFDGVSALLGIREVIEYEGQAAIELEQVIDLDNKTNDIVKYKIVEENSNFIIDTQSLFKNIFEYSANNIIDRTSAVFHNTIGAITNEMAEKIRYKTGLNKVVLSGGVFQNRYLTEKCVEKLSQSNFDVYIHSNVPSNDEGISLGQLIIGHYQTI